MDLSKRTPKDIDIELAQIWGRESQASSRRAWAQRTIEYFEKEGNQSHGLAEARASLAKYDAILKECNKQAQPLEAEYKRRRWTRHWHVANTNGHIHNTLRCSTCYATTRYAFRPELSGMNDVELVAIVGEVACTVCFPEAPTRKGFGDGTSMLAKMSEAERAAKEAEKQAKQAAKDAKGITQPDGNPLREDGGTGRIIQTLVSAKRELSNAVGWALVGHNIERQAKHVAEAHYLAEAIAHKIGSTKDEVLTEVTKKERKKLKASMKKVERTRPDLAKYHSCTPDEAMKAKVPGLPNY